ncbi:HD-GYP domain-containing protein [Peribacillus sp. SCS-26]|uniref:HD-GYP domain-containing protein n=1 Tax=Paraperibacillus marinus TaxID=3115295 RepID=UPI003906CCD7
MAKLAIKAGMVLAGNVYSESGALLLSAGTKLNKHHIELLQRHKIKMMDIGNLLKSDNPLKEAEESYSNILTDLTAAFNSLRDKETLDDLETREMLNCSNELDQKADLDVIQLKEQIKQDDYLYQHSLNVGLISKHIAKILGLGREEQKLLVQMGIFHDIGKFKVDPAIINKPARLTDEEYNEVKNHSLYGYDLIKGTSLPNEIKIGTLLHHERLDGSGYPNGLKAGDIPFLVRILSVADTFDAICSKRVYKGGSSILFAVEELLEDAAKGRLDNAIVRPFTKDLMKAIIGKSIKLRNGQSAVITSVHPDRPNYPVLNIEGYPPLDLNEANLALKQVAYLN